MSKKLIVAIVLVISMFFTMFGCNGKSSVDIENDTSGNVSGNGGFVVETGNYVYFINGVELYTEDNTAGDVVKAALVRAKKADVAAAVKNLTELSTLNNVEVEIVVPKLIVSSDYTSGIQIYGNYIYYATPYSTADKVGKIDNAKLDLCRTKLDGSDTKTIATAPANSSIYRFVEKDGVVYALFQNTVKNDDDEDISVISCYNADTQKEVFTSEKVAASVFSKDLDGMYVYYTVTVKDEILDTDESFNAVKRYKVGDSADYTVLYGAGSNNNSDTIKYEGKGVQGVTFTLIANENGYTYFSYSHVDKTPTTITNYCAVKDEELSTSDAEVNYNEKKTVLNNGTSAATTIFASSSFYNSLTEIMYLDSTNGLCIYNYEKPNYVDSYGIKRIYYDATIITAKVDYVKDGYIYYNVSGVYYRLKLNGSEKITDEPQQISGLTLYNTDSWYSPEVVTINNTDYFFCIISGDPYYEYVSVLAFTTEGNEVLKDNANELTFFKYEVATDDAEYVEFNIARRLAIMTDADKDSLADYMDSTFYNDSTSSDSTSSSCGSAVGFGSILGLALIGLSFVSIKRKSLNK